MRYDNRNDFLVGKIKKIFAVTKNFIFHLNYLFINGVLFAFMGKL